MTDLVVHPLSELVSLCTREIPVRGRILPNGSLGPKEMALVDNADYSELIKEKWLAIVDGGRNKGIAYALLRRRPGKSPRYMHQWVLPNIPKGLVRDHIDGNGLNNTRGNLRAVTQSQNMHNSRLSISWDAQRKKYRARIVINGVEHHLGRFETYEDAAKVVMQAKRRILNGIGR